MKVTAPGLLRYGPDPKDDRQGLAYYLNTPRGDRFAVCKTWGESLGISQTDSYQVTFATTRAELGAWGNGEIFVRLSQVRDFGCVTVNDGPYPTAVGDLLLECLLAFLKGREETEVYVLLKPVRP